MKIAQGVRPWGRLYCTFWSNLIKNFSFGGLYPNRYTDGGEIWHGGGDLPNFTPIGATCRPRGAKNLKIGVWVN